MSTTFHDLTETPGQNGSAEQLQRMFTRYRFALSYCAGKDVLEIACGAGQGLGYLAKQTRTVWGGDYTESLLRVAQAHYGSRIPLLRLDAHHLPVRDGSFDVILLYEALYYLSNPREVFREFRRVLKPGGTVLITLPNRSLPDFHPSPLSIRYYTPPELKALMEPLGFRATFYGDTLVDYSTLRNRILAFVKSMVVKMNLMPKTLKGRERLKRLIYGELKPIPAELEENGFSYEKPKPIASERPDWQYRVLFAVAEVIPR
jgi:ubiquinone/menaquinone biosynthesis C-methylase UbiE